MGFGQAYAGPLDLMRQFNVISYGNFQTGSDVEGRVLVGGNVTGLNTLANNPSRPPNGTSAYGELTVYGNQYDSSSHSINLAGGVTILGSNNGGFNIASGDIAVGGSNSGQLTTGNGAISVLGSNNSLLNSKGGHAVYVGNGNSGEIDTYGTGNTIAINGNNSGGLKPNNGGSVQIQGNNTGTVDLTGGNLTVSGTTNRANGTGNTYAGATVHLSQPSVTLPDFTSTFKTPLTQLSSQLTGLSATGTATVTGNSAKLTATAGSSGVAVLNVSSALFAANTNIYVNLPNGTSLVVNVTIPGCMSGSGCALNIDSSVHIFDSNNSNSSAIIASYLLWNFGNATSLTINNPWEGTILAPYAAMTDSNQPIDGTVVAASYTGVGELHSYPFAGTLASPAIGNTPVPEPSSIAVLLSGLATVGWLRRRRPGA